VAGRSIPSNFDEVPPLAAVFAAAVLPQALSAIHLAIYGSDRLLLESIPVNRRQLRMFC
jgi:hypothetical protein